MNKKWTKVYIVSQSKNTPRMKDFFLTRIWPKFCTKKISQLFQKTNMAKIMVYVQKRSKGVSDEVDFWHGENLEEEKCSKYRLSLRPPSWWNWSSKKTNIFLQISVHKLLASKMSFIQKGSTRPFFFTKLIEKCSFCPLQI